MLATLVNPLSANDDELSNRQELVRSKLEVLQNDIKLSDLQISRLNEEIDALEKDRASINDQLIKTARQERNLEEKLEKSEADLTKLFVEEQDVTTSLKQKSGLLTEVLGALQRLGRKPPPALLVRPQDALESIRSATLLGAVVPGIRDETRILLGELERLSDIREGLEIEKKNFATNRSELAEQEQKLTLLLREKRNLSDKSREALAEENAKAARLAAKARTLEELITSLESEIREVALAAEAARKLELERKQQQREKIRHARESIDSKSPSNADRIAPEMAFSDAKGLLPKPVNGVELVQFGQKTTEGILSNALTIATRANARVISPADGWVVYSGPFRTYGQLLILKVSNNHHILLYGMAEINVDLGEFILRGQPVGIMGTQRIASAVTNNVDLARPVLNIEFRHNGVSVDPAPWWQANTNQRANNDS